MGPQGSTGLTGLGGRAAGEARACRAKAGFIRDRAPAPLLDLLLEGVAVDGGRGRSPGELLHGACGVGGQQASRRCPRQPLPRQPLPRQPLPGAANPRLHLPGPLLLREKPFRGAPSEAPPSLGARAQARVPPPPAHRASASRPRAAGCAFQLLWASLRNCGGTMNAGNVRVGRTIYTRACPPAPAATGCAEARTDNFLAVEGPAPRI